MAINNEINNKYFTAFIKGLFGPNANLIYIPLKMKSKAIGTIREGDILYCVKHNVSGTYISFYRVNEEITLENTTIDSPDQEWDWTVEFGNKIQEINLDNIVDRLNSMSTTIAFLMESIPFVIKDNKIKIFNKLPILKYKDMLDYCRAGVNVFALFEDFGVRRDKFTKLTVNEQYKKYFDLEHRNVDGLIDKLDPENGKAVVYSDDDDMVHILYTSYYELNSNTFLYNKLEYSFDIQSKFMSNYIKDNTFTNEYIYIYDNKLVESLDITKPASEKVQKIVDMLNNKKNTIKQLNFENKYTITQDDFNFNRKIDYTENPPELKYVNKLRLLTNEDLLNSVINDTDNTKFANIFMYTYIQYFEENTEKSMIIYPLLVYANTPNVNNFNGNIRKVIEWRPPVIKNIDYSELTKKVSLTSSEIEFHISSDNIGSNTYEVSHRCVPISELRKLLDRSIGSYEPRYTPFNMNYIDTRGDSSDIGSDGVKEMLRSYPKEVRSSACRVYEPTIESGKVVENITISKDSDLIYNDVSDAITIFKPTDETWIATMHKLLNNNSYKLINRHYNTIILDYLKEKGHLKSDDINYEYIRTNKSFYDDLYNNTIQAYKAIIDASGHVELDKYNKMMAFFETEYGRSEDCKNKLFKNIYIPFGTVNGSSMTIYYMSMDGITDETSFKQRYDVIFSALKYGYNMSESQYNKYMRSDMIKLGIERMSGTPEEDDSISKVRNYIYVRVSENGNINDTTLFWCKVTNRRLAYEIPPTTDTGLPSYTSDTHDDGLVDPILPSFSSRRD